MTELNATPFLKAIEEDPDDPLPRLAYADWLEEQGQGSSEQWRLSAATNTMWCFSRRQPQFWNANITAALMHADHSQLVKIKSDQLEMQLSISWQFHQFRLALAEELLRAFWKQGFREVPEASELLEAKRKWISGEYTNREFNLARLAFQRILNNEWNTELQISVARQVRNGPENKDVREHHHLMSPANLFRSLIETESWDIFQSVFDRKFSFPKGKEVFPKKEHQLEVLLLNSPDWEAVKQ